MDFFEKLENLEDSFFSKFDKVGDAIVPKVEKTSQIVDNGVNNVVGSIVDMNANYNTTLIKKIIDVKEWDNYLYGIPKWSFGGSNSFIAYNGIFCGKHCYSFSVRMNTPAEAQECVMKYRELFLQNGWVFEVNPLHVFKIINNIKWHVDFEHIFGNDQRTLLISFDQV